MWEWIWNYQEWLEAGTANNLLISSNRIIGCCDAGIAVFSYGIATDNLSSTSGDKNKLATHNNIQVTNNIIQNSTFPAIALTSIHNLKLTGNEIKSHNPDLLLLQPWPIAKTKLGREEVPIYLKNVTKVEEEEV